MNEATRDFHTREAELVDLVWSHKKRLFDIVGVTSIGVGVRPEADPATAEVKDLRIVIKTTGELDEGVLPTTLGEGRLKSAVVHRRCRHSLHAKVLAKHSPPRPAVPESPAPRDYRRGAQARIQPGISIGNVRADRHTGTIGAIVFDAQTRVPYALSCSHVLGAGPDPEGQSVAQPGRHDDTNVGANRLGRVIRSSIGLAGDCALASIETRDFDEALFEIGRAPAHAARAELGDAVIKSSRTTHVTRGVVTQVGVLRKIDYGAAIGVRIIGGIEIRQRAGDAAVALSDGGDSGALWILDDDKGPEEGATAVALHVGGEIEEGGCGGPEHAFACDIGRVLDRLQVSFHAPLDQTPDQRIAELEARIALLESAGGCGCERGEHAEHGAQGVGEMGSPAVAEAPVAARDEVFAELDLSAEEQAEVDMWLATDLLGTGAERVRRGIKFWGNWCGPRYPHKTDCPDPVDDFDAACKWHDLCYRQHGRSRCLCDPEIVRRLRTLIDERGRGMGAVKYRRVRIAYAIFMSRTTMCNNNPAPVVRDCPRGTGRRLT